MQFIFLNASKAQNEVRFGPLIQTSFWNRIMPTLWAHFRVPTVPAKQNRVHWHRWSFCRHLQASWWPSTSMWSRRAKIWESRFVLLSYMQAGMWPSSHLPKLDVTWPKWLNVIQRNPKFIRASGKVWIIRTWLPNYMIRSIELYVLRC